MTSTRVSPKARRPGRCSSRAVLFRKNREMRNREPRMKNCSGSSFSVLGSSFPGFWLLIPPLSHFSNRGLVERFGKMLHAAVEHGDQHEVWCEPQLGKRFVGANIQLIGLGPDHRLISLDGHNGISGSALLRDVFQRGFLAPRRVVADED